DTPRRLQTGPRRGGLRVAHDRGVVFQPEWMVVETARELDLRLAAAVVGDLPGGAGEGGAVGAGDRRGEAGIGAAGRTVEMGVGGDDVGRFAGTLAVTSGETADIRRALAIGLMHLAEPAAALDLGQRQRRHHRRRDALFGMNTGVGGTANDFHFPALGAD